MQMNRGAVTRLVLVLLLLLESAACVTPARERVIFSDYGIRVGLRHDTTTDRVTPPARNSHPPRLTQEEVRAVLGFLQVSGYSGTIMGVFVTPRPIALLNDEEMHLLAAPITHAFEQAGVQDRVFFSVPDRQTRYNEDRTEGMLFLRDPYLHVVLTDHYAFARADTAGGEDLKDPRDTKGMKLFVASPAKAATLSSAQAPRWSALDRIHLSFNVRDALAASAALPSRPATGGESSEDLRLQIRELTASNQELRARLEEQAKQMDALKAELARLRQALGKGATPPQPGRRDPLR